LTLETERQYPDSTSYLPPGWPIFLVLYGFVAFWALGVSSFIWVIVAVPMLIALLTTPDARLPRGLGLWMLFLGWAVLSVVMLGSGGQAVVWGYRYAIYLASGIAMIYAYNLPRRQVGAYSAVKAMGTYWLFIVASGFLSLFLPDLTFQSPVQALLPGNLSQDPFVVELTQPRLAQVHDFLGFEVTRPAGPEGSFSSGVRSAPDKPAGARKLQSCARVGKRSTRLTGRAHDPPFPALPGILITNGTRVAFSQRVDLCQWPFSPRCQPWSDHNTTMVRVACGDSASADSTRPSCSSAALMDARYD
jgi:hypothetical protein